MSSRLGARDLVGPGRGARRRPPAPSGPPVLPAHLANALILDTIRGCDRALGLDTEVEFLGRRWVIFPELGGGGWCLRPLLENGRPQPGPVARVGEHDGSIVYKGEFVGWLNEITICERKRDRATVALPRSTQPAAPSAAVGTPDAEPGGS